MSIANLENVVSNAEHRAIVSGESWIVPRVCDLTHVAPSSRGKLELTMSEDDGQEDQLVTRIVAEAVKIVFSEHADIKDYRSIVEHFDTGKALELGDSLAADDVVTRIEAVPGLRKRAEELSKRLFDLPAGDADFQLAALASAAEFILEGLHVHNKLNKNVKGTATAYRR